MNFRTNQIKIKYININNDNKQQYYLSQKNKKINLTKFLI